MRWEDLAPREHCCQPATLAGLVCASVVALSACVGFSAALPHQIREAIDAASVATRAQPGVLLALGGCVTKERPVDANTFDFIANPQSSVDTARELAALMAQPRAG